MEGIEHFDEAKNLARVSSGMRGGPFNKSLNLAPKMTFVDGYPETVAQEMKSSTPKMNIIDPWVYRRSNAKM